VDLNSLFERFLTNALRAALAHHGGHTTPQFKSYLDTNQAIRIVPDLVWSSLGRPRVVADIKYKSTAIKGLPNADVYQALAYAIGLDLAAAHLIYAEGSSDVTHEIQGSGRIVTIHHIDLSKPPRDLLGQIENLADLLVLSAQDTVPDLNIVAS
jgi:5-methylcytosine-specific restriction enzyme subunit McrC